MMNGLISLELDMAELIAVPRVQIGTNTAGTEKGPLARAFTKCVS
jgi:hypothetical protein